jgi:8-oxo-dGTP pyrophosphatase MutT (NUDIX family)
MSFLDRIAECNNHDPAAYRAFVCAGHRIGAVRHRLAERLRDFPGIFAVSADKVVFSDAYSDAEQRSAAIEKVVRVLEADGIVTGRRNEAYPALVRWGEAPLFRIERAAAPHFGIRSFGVHMTGYVPSPDGPKIWVPRRAKTKPTYPGMLDNTVGGGQPVGIGLHDNMVKECWEEAGIPPEIARRAVCTGIISYRMDGIDGLEPDVQFCFDLELPADFVPRNTDGEIDEFFLWSWRKTAEVVGETREFMFNCNLVLIDFFVRHGLLDPGRPDYLDIVAGLRR